VLSFFGIAGGGGSENLSSKCAEVFDYLELRFNFLFNVFHQARRRTESSIWGAFFMSGIPKPLEESALICGLSAWCIVSLGRMGTRRLRRPEDFFLDLLRTSLVLSPCQPDRSIIVLAEPNDWRDTFIYFLLVDRFDNNQEDLSAYHPDAAARRRDPEQGKVFQDG
jgi:hypothetical protein